MIGWIIASPFLLIAALLALVMFCWSKVTLRFRSVNEQGQGEMEVFYGILFFRFKLMPGRPKKVNLKDYSPEAIRKKEEQRRLNAEKKAAKKKAAAEKKAAKKQAAAEKKKQEKEAAKKDPAVAHRQKQLKKKKMRDTLHTVKFFARLAGRLIKQFNSHLQVDIRRFVITVGDADPAKAAILYGLVSQAASYLFGILESCCNIHYKRNAHTAVEVDFLSEKISAELDITIRIKGWHFVALGISALMAILTRKKK